MELRIVRRVRDHADRCGRGRRAAWRRMLRQLCQRSIVVLILFFCTLAPRAAQKAAGPLWDTGTFSILGYDPDTGEVGGAVQSRVFSVGNGVLWADANVGVAATQAIVDVSYGQKALDFLKQGVEPADV